MEVEFSNCNNYSLRKYITKLFIESNYLSDRLVSNKSYVNCCRVLLVLKIAMIYKLLIFCSSSELQVSPHRGFSKEIDFSYGSVWQEMA